MAGEGGERGSIVSNAIGKCPEASVKVGDVELRSLLDSGAQVSTITERFYREHLMGKYDLVDTSTFINITAANGWSVPYVGYLELDVSIMGTTYPQMGFLVAKDAEANHFAARKREVPGVIGSNILQRVSEQVSWGSKSQSRNQPRDASDTWHRVLKLYDHELLGKAEVKCPNVHGHMGYVRVASSEPVLIPAGTARKVDALAPKTLSERSYDALVERITAEHMSLPKGLRVASTYSSIDKGRTCVHVANFGSEDAYIPKKAILGQLKEKS